jgi:5-methylcytosine-specific restriction endonuclease McrA
MARDPGRTGRPWRRIRAQVLAVSTVCWLCGKPGATTVDHVIPLNRGGAPLDPRNLRPAHRWCNSRKGDQPAEPVATSRVW